TWFNDNEPYVAAWLRTLYPEAVIDERSILDVRAADLVGHPRCHFFAGIGGWEYALELAGWPEDEPVWTASLPCQPWSSAGRHDGYADERDLWPVFLRLVESCRPPVIVGEQVASADVVGAAADADLYDVWSPATLLRISQWIQGAKVPPMQDVHDGGSERLA